MNKHHLKINPEHYYNVKDGTKTFEIRKNDRGFQKGDLVTLFYWPRNADAKYNDYPSSYTSEETPYLNFTIGDVYPIDNETVVFSLLKEMKDGK